MVQHYGLIKRQPISLRPLHFGLHEFGDRTVWAATEPIDYGLVFDALLCCESADAAVPLAEGCLDILSLEGLNEHV